MINLQAVDICNSRCVMCNIWREGKRETLSLEELRALFAQPFFAEVTHVGVTGGEPTLRKDLFELYRMLPEVLPKFAGGSFISHGMQTEKTVSLYTRVHEHYRAANLRFDGMISLDGVGSVHDGVRGRKGAFEAASRTLLELKRNGVPAIAACTIVRRNVYGLHDLLAWGQANGIYIRFRVAEFIRRLYNESCAPEIRAFSPREIRHLVSFLHVLLTGYEKEDRIQRTYRSILSLLTGGERLISCPYQDGRALNVDSRGGVACCAPKGPAATLPVDVAEAHALLDAHRSEVRSRHCASCIHDYHDDWTPAVREQAASASLCQRRLYKRPDEELTTGELPAEPFGLAGMSRLLLAGWYGTETAGDIAILQGIVGEYLAINPNLRFVVLSLYPYYTRTTLDAWPEELRARVETIDYESGEAWRATEECDALVMAGGPLMDIPETAKVLGLFKRFAELGKPRVIEGCGVGPLNKEAYRWNVIRIARLATRISVRDAASRDLLRAFGIGKPIEVRSDPAVAFLRAQGVRHNGRDAKVIRCFLRELTSEYPQSVTPAQATARLAGLLKNLLAWHPEHRIELWAMHHFPVGHDDRLFARRLAGAVADPRLTVDWEPRTPREIVEAMAAADFCVCMRFHSCVFASEVGVPFLAIDYTAGGKIQSFLEETGQAKRLCSLAGLDGLDAAGFAARVRPAQVPASVAGPEPRPVVLHLIESVSGGGGARAMMALAREVDRLGHSAHRLVSLLPSDATGLTLAKQAGLEVVDQPSRERLRAELAAADLVLVHWWNAPELAELFRRELPAMRLALWLHVGGYHPPHALTRPLLNFADLAVACSPHTHAHPAFEGLAQERQAMVLAGADFDRLEGFSSRAHKGFRVGYIGTLDPMKMHADYVAMSCAVRVPGVRFVVCGHGDSRWLREGAGKLGRAESFEFRGQVEDIRSVLEELDVYGYPLCPDTYAAAELNLQEAMFAGLPVVSFPHGGIGRLISHGETGWLVNSAEEYARAIEFLHTNPAERARLGANAAAFARRHWGAGNAARGFDALFSRMLEQPKRARLWAGGVDRGDLRELALNPGARLFIESLGDAAADFLVSVFPGSAEDALEAETRIAGMPRLMYHVCAIRYRKLYPNDPYLNLWAGLALLRAGHASEALACFELARNRGFAHWRIWWYRALAAEKAGRVEDSRASLKMLLQAAPQFTPARERLNALPDAARSSESVAQELVGKAQQQLGAGQLVPARESLARALALMPGQIILMELVADIDCRLGNLDSARVLHDDIVRLEPRRSSPRLQSIQNTLRARAALGVAAVQPSARGKGEVPCVSVITVVRNAAGTVGRTVESVLAQSHREFEHLVIDGVSTDGTADRVRAFADPRVKFTSEPDQGIYDAMNKGIRASAGEILHFLNADDRFHDPSVLAAVVRAFGEHPEVDVIYTDHVGVNGDGSLSLSIKPCPVPAAWFERTNFCHQSMFFRRGVFDRFGSYDTGFRMLADMHWNLRALLEGAKFAYLPIRSVYFSNTGAHTSEAQAARVAAEREAILDGLLRGRSVDGFATLRLAPAGAEVARSVAKVLFLAHGPAQVNGPNVWLTRLLPALKARGFEPRVLMFMTGDRPCPIIEQLCSAGITCDTSPWAHTEDMVRTILNHVRANPCDVFVPNLNVQGYFAASLLKAAGIPTVGVLHSDDDFHRDLTDEFIRGQGGRHLSAAVSVSVFQHEALLALDHGPTRIVRAPCGAPVPEVIASHRAKPFRFVYVGRLVDEQKRISDTVRAMIALLLRHPAAEFHLCGDGSARPAVEALIKSSRLGNRIRLHGNLPSDEVRRVLLDSQAMVLLSDYEGIPIALMEAMGCGVVPICTKIRSGIGEIIRDGENGLLVTDRAGGFVAAAERLMHDPALWARCSAAARAVIQENFSVEANADTWARLLGDLQAAAPGPRQTIEIPSNLDLPPVRTNPKGIAREDRRKPQSVPPAMTSTAPHPFTNPPLEPNNADLYWVRSSILRAVTQALPQFHGTFLDIGCGVMPYRELITRAPSRVTRYIGLDIETPTYRAEVDMRWDGRSIPLPDASVDCAMATEVIEHCPEPLVVLKEARRVLKPGGVFFFTVPYVWPLHDAPYDFHRYTIFTLERLLAEAGFADVQIQAMGGWNASLAQMLGLWLKRAPLAPEARNRMAQQLWPLYQELVKTDVVPSNPKAGNTMTTGWSGIVRVPQAATEPAVASTPATQVVSNADKRGDLPVVLVRSHEYNYSETFVEDHVNHLTSNLTLLYGFPFPRFLKGGRSVVTEAVEGRIQAALASGKGVTADLWRDYTVALSRFLKSCGAESVLVETGLMGAFVHEACEQASLPYVVHFHGVDAFGRELLNRWQGHYKKFFGKAAAVVAVSKAMRRQLVKLGAPAERVLLAPYGVSTDLPKQADPAKAPPQFVAVGRFVEKKAPHFTLRAFAAVHRLVPEARLVMIGDGPLLGPCQHWARENGLADVVTFAGVQSREEVSCWMASGRVFVQHSVTAPNGDSEGLPLAILEAGAHGLPVVSTRHAGIPDAVRDGVDGLLVAEKDVEGMAQAMLRLARDSGLAGKLGASFRERVVAGYSRERSLTRLLNILKAAARDESTTGLGEPDEEPAGSSASPVAVASVEADPRVAIAENRNDHAASLELGRSLLAEGKLADAYLAVGEAHRLTEGTPETQGLLQKLEEGGVLGVPAVEDYRRRVGWLARRKSAQARRILVVTNLLPPQEMGGYGRTMWEFSRELQERGHAVRVLAADMPHLMRKPTADHEAFEPNVRRVLRLCGDWKGGVVQPETDQARVRQVLRHNHETILAAVKKFRPDVIMAGNLDFVGSFFIKEMLARGIPVLHRLGNANPGYEPSQAPSSPLFCLAGCSAWVNDNLRAKAYPITRYAVLPPGAPLTDYFRAFQPQRTRLRIAFASLLMPYKGAHVLVEALGLLRRLGIDFECTLAGDTTSADYVEKLRAFAQAQGFADRLSFPGFLAKSELAALFARSNVLVFPSVFEEPFGKTQIEAMAAGLTVVSSGSGGAREIIRDGETGLLFKGGDSRDLAEKLACLHRQPDYAARLAAAGQASAFDYTTGASVDRLEALFEELIAAASRQSSPELVPAGA